MSYSHVGSLHDNANHHIVKCASVHHQSKVTMAPVKSDLRSPFGEGLGQIATEPLSIRIKVSPVYALCGEPECINAIIVCAYGDKGLPCSLNLPRVAASSFGVSVSREGGERIFYLLRCVLKLVEAV